MPSHVPSRRVRAPNTAQAENSGAIRSGRCREWLPRHRMRAGTTTPRVEAGRIGERPQRRGRRRWPVVWSEDLSPLGWLVPRSPSGSGCRKTPFPGGPSRCMPVVRGARPPVPLLYVSCSFTFFPPQCGRCSPSAPAERHRPRRKKASVPPASTEHPILPMVHTEAGSACCATAGLRVGKIGRAHV